MSMTWIHNYLRNEHSISHLAAYSSGATLHTFVYKKSYLYVTKWNEWWTTHKTNPIVVNGGWGVGEGGGGIGTENAESRDRKSKNLMKQISAPPCCWAKKKITTKGVEFRQQIAWNYKMRWILIKFRRQHLFFHLFVIPCNAQCLALGSYSHEVLVWLERLWQWLDFGLFHSNYRDCPFR